MPSIQDGIQGGGKKDGRPTLKKVAVIRILGIVFAAVLFLLVGAAFAGVLPRWVGWTSLLCEAIFVPYFIRKIRDLCRC